MNAKRVTFPRWPTWNYHFPEPDVVEITGVKYYDTANVEQTYPLDKVRHTCGHNGVAGIVFKEKHDLPPTAERPDAVTIEYEV